MNFKNDFFDFVSGKNHQIEKKKENGREREKGREKGRRKERERPGVEAEGWGLDGDDVTGMSSSSSDAD